MRKVCLLIICILGATIPNFKYWQPPPLIYLSQSAISQRGAVCLDGSAPAYSIDPGSGSGENSWIVHLQGGSWCGSVEECLQRSFTDLGSSKYMTAIEVGGILSNSPSDNPDFYNWNRVFVRYCDGGSFAGNVNLGMQITANGQVSTLYFRGQEIWEAIIDELLTKGLASANRAILSGDSAGGLASFFHCNRFQGRFSPQIDVKCLCDGGFFMDIPNIAGVYSFREIFQDIVTLHNITLLPLECTSQMSLGQCFFPEYSLASIKVPLFILQSPYDNYQIRSILAPSSSYSNGSWDACKQDLSSCSVAQLSIIHGALYSFLVDLDLKLELLLGIPHASTNMIINEINIFFSLRYLEVKVSLINFQNLADQLSGKMLEALSPLVGSRSWGMYMVSCYYHTEAVDSSIWNGATKINDMNPAQAFHLWYFDGDRVQEIDCSYPCNPTCIKTSS